ncbi:hypothetical protein Tco_0672606 [Tanacetum coccineum]
MQKNLLKQQFETFTIGSREELDSAYERFQHILSMLELHDATVSIEDANNLNISKTATHLSGIVVASMIRGCLKFKLLNKLLLCPLKSRAVLEQCTAEPAHIPKDILKLSRANRAKMLPTVVSHSDEIICSFFAQQASCPTTHDVEGPAAAIDECNGRN